DHLDILFKDKNINFIDINKKLHNAAQNLSTNNILSSIYQNDSLNYNNNHNSYINQSLNEVVEDLMRAGVDSWKQTHYNRSNINYSSGDNITKQTSSTDFFSKFLESLKSNPKIARDLERLLKSLPITNESENIFLPSALNDTIETSHETLLADADRRPPAKHVWGYSFLFVTIICICSMVGVVFISFMKKKYYKLMLQFMIGLAVGSLSGSAVFHLIPQSFNLMDTDIHHSYINKSATIIGGIYLFFITEWLIKVFLEWRRTNKLAKDMQKAALKISNDGNAFNSFQKPTSNGFFPPVGTQSTTRFCRKKDIIKRLLTCTCCTTTRTQNNPELVNSKMLQKHDQNNHVPNFNNGHISIDEKLGDPSSRKSSSQTNKTHFTFDVENNKSDQKVGLEMSENEKLKQRLLANGPLDGTTDSIQRKSASASNIIDDSLGSVSFNFFSPNQATESFRPKSHSFCHLDGECSKKSILRNGNQRHSHDERNCTHNNNYDAVTMRNLRDPYIINDDDAPALSITPAEMIRTCSHEDGLHFAGQNTILTLAYMILLGDGLHNFIDGLSIGAAFSQNVLTGVSISLAVIFEELPHELGDFAILLNSGMPVKKAMLCNFLSASTCYLGMFFGIILGENQEASFYIFALAAGMFLYISLVDMMPELNKSIEKANKLGKLPSTLVIQYSGIALGLTSMSLLAKYGSSIAF
ncbi:unnamed protein product, partial [Gordionus sp. m RMFG-2023]